MNDKNIPAKKIIDDIKLFVEKKGKAITHSQLRNIYSKILALKDDDITGLQLIRPKLAYVAARQKNKEAGVLVRFFDEMISEINNTDEFKSFKTFMESVVAYHKFYHPDKN